MCCCRQANVNLESGEGLDDVDHSVLFFNQAIILYHLRQNKAALAILDKLFPYIDPISSSGGGSLCCLFVSVYVICNMSS